MPDAKTKLRIPRAGVLAMTGMTEDALTQAGRFETDFPADEAAGFAAGAWFRADTRADEVIGLDDAARRMSISIAQLRSAIDLRIIPVGQNKKQEKVIPYACFRYWKDNRNTELGRAFLAEIMEALDEAAAAAPITRPGDVVTKSGTKGNAR